jgi:hypothetical protein
MVGYWFIFCDSGSTEALHPRHVYGTHGASRSLELVKCGGVFDHATGHYLSNVVVYSRLLGVSIPHLLGRNAPKLT